MKEIAPHIGKSIIAPIVPKKLIRTHIYDEAKVLPHADILKFEKYLEWIFEESDIDIRFIFMPEITESSIEDLAVRKVDELGIGGQSREERGVLLLYDLSKKQLRIEVGYGLEEYFTDSFVSYLVDDHTKSFFLSGDLTTGLRLLIRMLHHVIREATLGNRFDPRLIENIKKARHLSGGAGVTSIMPEKVGSVKNSKKAVKPVHDEYLPQETPQAVYEKYLQWLAAGNPNPKIEIFTRNSQQYMASLPMTDAYFSYIYMQEYGREYEIEIRDNVAILLFTNDPLVSPHFFLKSAKGWQMDIVSEARNIRSRVGGIYIWDYGGKDDIYTKTFLDKLIVIKNYIRLKGGDNRQLPTRENI